MSYHTGWQPSMFIPSPNTNYTPTCPYILEEPGIVLRTANDPYQSNYQRTREAISTQLRSTIHSNQPLFKHPETYLRIIVHWCTLRDRQTTTLFDFLVDGCDWYDWRAKYKIAIGLKLSNTMCRFFDCNLVLLRRIVEYVKGYKM